MERLQNHAEAGADSPLHDIKREKEMKEKATTMTELQFRAEAKERDRIWEYLMSGKWKGQKVEIEVYNWCDLFGKFVCRIEKFVPRKLLTLNPKTKK